jgi:hypothetical protein
VKRAAVALGALTLVVGALVGVRFSGATWTHDTTSGVDVQAAYDWTDPEVTFTPLAAGSFDTITLAVQVTDRSAIASVQIQYRPFNSQTWTALPGCPTTGGDSPLAYSCNWDSNQLPDADYDMRAVVTDTATPTPYTGTSNVVTTQVVNNGGLVLSPLRVVVSGTVDLSAQFISEDPLNGAKTSIEYQTGGTWTELPGCFANAAVVTCSWNTTAYANGVHHLRARLDAGNEQHTDTQFLTVDNAAPSVTGFTVPSGILSGVVGLSATAADAHSSVASVRFEHKSSAASSWSVCGTDASAPYGCSLGTTGLDGTHDFRVVVTDAAGNTVTSAVQSRTISNVPAAVAVTSPAAGAEVSGDVPVTVDAQSGRGVESVAVQYRQGATGGFSAACTATSSPWTCTWNTAGLPAGSYQLRAVLTEASGGATVTSEAVSVTVAEGAEGVSVTGPAAGAMLNGAVAVTAAATAQGGVAGVSIQARPSGGSWTEICADPVAPYSCTWDTSGVAWTDFELQAVMTRTVGGTLASAPVAVKVDNVVGSLDLVIPTTPLVKGAVEVAAQATSNAPIQGVELQRRPTSGGAWETICVDATDPYTCTYDTTPTAYGWFEVRGVMTLANGQTVTEGPTEVEVDNRTLAGYDVDAADDGTPGMVAVDDSIVLTWTGRVDAVTLGLGQAGATTVTFNGISGSGNDEAVLGGNLGTLSFPQDYVKTNTSVGFNATATLDETFLPGAPGAPVTRVTITLDQLLGDAGNLRELNTNNNLGSIRWTPSAGAKDRFGTGCAIGTVTEIGSAGVDF